MMIDDDCACLIGISASHFIGLLDILFSTYNESYFYKLLIRMLARNFYTVFWHLRIARKSLLYYRSCD